MHPIPDGAGASLVFGLLSVSMARLNDEDWLKI